MKNGDSPETYPLSPLQAGMLFHSLAGLGTGVDIEQIICDVPESLDLEAFQRAWARVVERHAVLRTRFEWKGIPEPRQVVVPKVSFRGEWFDWQSLSVDEQQACLETYIEKERAKGFDLSQVPLMRLALFGLSKNRYKFVWSFHHILLDGRAFPLLLEEVFTFYEAFVENRHIDLDEPRPFRDYVAWVRERGLEKDQEFWRENLEGFASPTPLVVGVPLDTRKRTMGEQGIVEASIPKSLTFELRHLAASHGLSMNTLVEGSWALLLHRYSGEEDILYGTTRSCRHSAIKGADSMVGLLINTIPIRIRIKPQTEVLNFLKGLRDQHVKMREYIHAPLYEIQGWSPISAGSPLFESLVVFENYALGSYMRSKGGRWVNREFEHRGRTNYPLTLVGYDDEELQLALHFDAARFPKDTAERIIGHFQTILGNIPGNLDKCVVEIPILIETERNQLLLEWNDTTTEYPRERCVHGLFEEQVQKAPDAVAVDFDGKQLTYEQLNERANQVAHHLQQMGVGPEVLVGVYLERSLEMVVGLLGILKAGGAYLPIDLAYPKERVAFMLEDAQAQVLLTQADLTDALPKDVAKLVHLDQEWEVIAKQSKENLPNPVTAKDLAYVMYTSGSTGIPKGVAVPHRAITRLVCNTNYIKIDPSDRIAQASNAAFDAATFEIWGALVQGARLVGISRDVMLSPREFAAQIREQAITTLFLTTALFNQLAAEAPGAFNSLHHLLFGGEAVDPRWVKEVLENSPPRRLLHVYGPTETTTFASWYLVKEVPQGATTVPIGAPISNTQFYVLDAHRQPVPIGVAGELYIGGDGLARGYLNRPELTAEKFIPNSYSSDPEAKLYKTGDLVRYLPDGNIEFLGRIDQQVKLRGFRIELGEIETLLRQHPSVRDVIVLAREDSPGEKRLVAYLVVEEESTPTTTELRSFLKEKMPDYMVPSAFVILEAFPLTPNGKIDRRALPEPHIDRQSEEGYMAPRNEVERTIAEIWQALLKIEKVGIHDNFFELGGHSLLATQVISRISRAFGVEASLERLFETPTVAGLADYIETIRWTSGKPPSAVAVGSSRDEGRV